MSSQQTNAKDHGQNPNSAAASGDDPKRSNPLSSVPISATPSQPHPYTELQPTYLYLHRSNLLRTFETKGNSRWKNWLHQTLPHLVGKKGSHSTDAEGQAEKVEEPKEWIQLSFVELQRMRLRKLQRQLIHDTCYMYVTNTDPGKNEKEHHFEGSASGNYEESEIGEHAGDCEWELKLKEYVQALRDYEYMTTFLSESYNDSSSDPFVATTKDEAVSEFVHEVAATDLIPSEFWPQHADGRMGKREDWLARSERERRFFEGRGDLPLQPVVGTRLATVRAAKLSSFYMKILMAAVSGAFLIVPMWLMVLTSGKYTALISTTLFVIAFGLLAAWFLEKPLDVVAVTSAYAAVLVVFVGTTDVGTGTESF